MHGHRIAPHLTAAFTPRPILKWVGGKQIIAGVLARYFPSGFKRYFEPFVGGCSVALEIAARKAVLSDQNGWLIDTYRAVRDDWRLVASILDTLLDTQEEFYRIRSIDPRSLDLVSRAAHLIYLNKTCFRGLFRVNKRNQFNVPYGNYKRQYYNPENLSAFSTFLRHCELRSTDFENALRDVTPDDFVYLDPPYYRIGGCSDFNRYTSAQFKEADHMRLRNICVELDDRGIRWVQSNSCSGFIRELYRDFRFDEIKNRREINLKSNDRSITELVIRNF